MDRYDASDLREHAQMIYDETADLPRAEWYRDSLLQGADSMEELATLKREVRKLDSLENRKPEYPFAESVEIVSQWQKLRALSKEGGE